MVKQRGNLGFEEALNDFNISEWSSKSEVNKKLEKVTQSRIVEQAAIAAGFQSREPKQGLHQEEKKPRRRRTGRNAQFNLKARPETIAAFCNVADKQGWGLGETLEKAVFLLERELS